MRHNLILSSDSYKSSHNVQYPPGIEFVLSYFESRGGAYDETVFFGLQYILKEYLSKPVTKEDLDEAEDIIRLHMGRNIFNYAGWKYIIEEHGGYLPLLIKAVPEGSVVDTKNVLMTAENTDPKCFWLTNYVEGLLAHVWYASTVATRSREMKKTILNGLEISGDPSLIDYKLHDFGFRGSTSLESAGIGGCAHLVNFKGTDNLPALRIARYYYGEEMAGRSINASEHSTITSWGREDEAKAYENMLDQWPSGTIACVSDSYDIYNACENIWGDQLREKVLSREGTLVARPDSGEPVEVLPRVMDSFERKFGYTTNKKGYKVLNPKVSVIQGDHVDEESLPTYIQCLLDNDVSVDNISFGSGGGLLQKLDRDTSKYAFKCSEVVVEGQPRAVYKQPVDCPWKTSKKGRLKLQRDGEGWKTISRYDSASFDGAHDELVEVYLNGNILVDQSFAEIRERAKV